MNKKKDEDVEATESNGMLAKVIAVSICVALIVLLSIGNIYPSGYVDVNTQHHAGHGYHSLASVVGEGFYWHADTVPHQANEYYGSGPYAVTANFLISFLYIPLFIAIAFIGYMISVKPGFKILGSRKFQTEN